MYLAHGARMEKHYGVLFIARSVTFSFWKFRKHGVIHAIANLQNYFDFILENTIFNNMWLGICSTIPGTMG
jgi:hypothetical protein